MKDFIKNNKVAFIVLIIVVLVLITTCFILISSNKKENKTTSVIKEPQNLTEAVAQKNNKDVNSYKKISSGAEILNRNNNEVIINEIIKSTIVSLDF